MAKHRFKVMFNGHTDFTTSPPTIHEKGSVIETDRELDKIYENKFQRVAGKKQQSDTVLGPEEFLKSQQEKNNSVGLEEEILEEDVPLIDSPLNENTENIPNVDGTRVSGPEEVTSKFPLAKKSDLKVFFDGSSHSVTDADDKKNTPLNKNKKLITDKDVNSFIKSHK